MALSDVHCIVLRSFHQSSVLYKEEVSKVKQTVNALKDERKQIEKKAVATTEAAAEAEVKASPSVTEVAPKPEAQVIEAKKTLWDKTKNAVMHYYHGFRLLFIDVRVLMKNLWAVLNGQTLTRRERNQVNELSKMSHMC